MSQNVMRVEVQKKLVAMNSLPASSKIVQDVIGLWEDPNTPIIKYEKAIGKDPGLVAEVLRLVNSPYYGLKNQVTNLKLALSLLGLSETYRIVVNRGFYTTFRELFKNIDFDIDVFWHHSQVAANTARYLAEKFHPALSSEAYVAGLLHDVGKLAMARFFPDQWKELQLEFEWHEGEPQILEEKIFGMTHCDVAAVLLAHWHIPIDIIAPVRYHHGPLAAGSHQNLVNIVYFAEKTAIYLMSVREQKSVFEFFSEDETWFKMIEVHEEMNLVGDKAALEAAKPFILRQMGR